TPEGCARSTRPRSTKGGRSSRLRTSSSNESTRAAGRGGEDIMRAFCGVVAWSLVSLLAAGPAAAQSYPEQAIRILVGFTPGVAPDITARLLADKLSEAWGKPVIIENITGAGGNIATDRVAKAAPDG